MTHNPTDSNGVPYAMSHEVRAEREAIIAYLRAQADRYDKTADYYFGVKQAIPAYNAQMIAMGLRLAADKLEYGWDIQERPTPLPAKIQLVWGITAGGIMYLAKPGRPDMEDAYYSADESMAARYATGEHCTSHAKAKGVADGVALIIKWATGDGYEVPPCPYDLE